MRKRRNQREANTVIFNPAPRDLRQTSRPSAAREETTAGNRERDTGRILQKTKSAKRSPAGDRRRETGRNPSRDRGRETGRNPARDRGRETGKNPAGNRKEKLEEPQTRIHFQINSVSQLLTFSSLEIRPKPRTRRDAPV